MGLTQIVGLFNIAIGVLFVLSLLNFLGGFIAWLMLLGKEHRSDAVTYMKTGVEMLFVLVVLLYGVQMFQKHTAIATTIVAGVVIAGIAWYIIPDLMAPAEEAKKPAAGAKPPEKK